MNRIAPGEPLLFVAKGEYAGKSRVKASKGEVSRRLLGGTMGFIV
jgi:hypothetical protein